MINLFESIKDFDASHIARGMLLLVFALSVMIGATHSHAVMFVVNSNIDTPDDTPGDTLCDDGAGNCTLRAAVMETNDLAGQDTIAIPAGTYVLTLEGGDNFAAVGDLDIRDDLIIQGSGTKSTIIDGNGSKQIFHLLDGDGLNQITVEFYDLTITNANSGNAGGAIRNAAEIVVLETVAITGNMAPRGAGIYIGPDAEGTIVESVIDNNITAGDPGDERGGGIYNRGALTLRNVTISNNAATDLGGGIYNDSELDIKFTTIASNITVSGSAGGIYQAAGSMTSVWGSIIANNITSDCGGIFIQSDGNNISTTLCNLIDPTDMPNTNPMIGILADNGGPTMTHGILEGSPAIDSADNPAECNGTDQRGTARPQDGDGNGFSICDMGAVEHVFGAVSESGGGCSLATNTTSTAFPLYLLIPALILTRRLMRRNEIEA